MLERQTFDKIKAGAPEWLVPDRYGKRIPLGALTVIAGIPGGGKSTTSIDLAAEVSRSGRHVILSNVEDSEDYLRLRLEVAGADLTKVETVNPHFPEDTAEFTSIIEEEGTALVILDPIGAHFGGLIYQEAEFRKCFRPIRKALEKTGCAMVGIHHTIDSVKKKSHPLRALGGPQGSLKGTARSIWIFGENPLDEEERVLAYVKDNCGTSKDSILFEVENEERTVRTRSGKRKRVNVQRVNVIDDECSISANKVLHGDEEGKTTHTAVKKAAAAEWLEDYLCLGAQPQKALREDAIQAGFSWATMRRAAKEVGVVSGRKGFGQGSYVLWRLPDEHPALIDTSDEDDVAEDAEGVEVAPVDDREEDVEEVEGEERSGPCCDAPELDQEADGTIVCQTCSHVHGVQESIDSFLAELQGEGEGGGE